MAKCPNKVKKQTSRTSEHGEDCANYLEKEADDMYLLATNYPTFKKGRKKAKVSNS